MNELGYSLQRDKGPEEIDLGRSKVSLKLFDIQRKTVPRLSPVATSPRLLSVKTIQNLLYPCGGELMEEEIKQAQEQGPVKEFSPFNWEGNRSSRDIGDKKRALG